MFLPSRAFMSAQFATIDSISISLQCEPMQKSAK